MNKGKPTAGQMALQCALFHLKTQIVFKLQDEAYQTPELIAFRKALVDELAAKVQELDKNSFAVKQHLKYVELYANPDNYAALTYENTLQIKDELAPLIIPDNDEIKAVRFDALIYGIELAYLAGRKYNKARSDLIKKVNFKPNVIVVDPPRSGLDESVISDIIKLKPERLVYVSCDPMTLARDLSLLNDKYEIIEVTPVDMFPNTNHVENIVEMVNK